MDNASLVELLEADREMTLAAIAKDRSPAGAQAALEKAVDRVMYRYVEQCGDARLSEFAQGLLQAAKNTLPVIGAVNKAREWRSASEKAEDRRKLRPAAMAFLGVGIVLAVITLPAIQFGARGAGMVTTLLRSALPTIAGAACVFWAGVITGRPRKPGKDETPDVRIEFLVDAEAAWRQLRAVMVLADGSLSTMREEAEARQAMAPAVDGATFPAETIDLLSGLLEQAYAHLDGEHGDDAREMISEIRYFLHRGQVEIVDYTQAHATWFEMLPSARPGTIRPALATDGRLLKKGLASA